MYKTSSVINAYIARHASRLTQRLLPPKCETPRSSMYLTGVLIRDDRILRSGRHAGRQTFALPLIIYRTTWSSTGMSMCSAKHHSSRLRLNGMLTVVLVSSSGSSRLAPVLSGRHSPFTDFRLSTLPSSTSASGLSAFSKTASAADSNHTEWTARTPPQTWFSRLSTPPHGQVVPCRAV